MSDYFLNVEQSASGQKWVPRLSARGQALALQIAQTTDIDEIVARILAGRGVVADQAEKFLNPTIKALMPSPLTMTDMDKAATRLAEAIQKNQRIAIFGDYDVDGATSSALMKRFLGHFGIQAKIHIPDRIFEGYGPNVPAMEELAANHDLIVTVDCGTVSREPIVAAIAKGADVLVLDHHQQAGALPECSAVVNPNREDDLSGLGYLCAAGVVFMAMVATSTKLRDGNIKGPNLLEMLDLVALGTVADVVPLIGLNRAFVTKGVLVARAQSNMGMAALAKVARIGEPLNPFHFGFVIGPRINAGGRIGNAALGAELLTLNDEARAEEIATQLDGLNRERQAMEQVMLQEAEAEFMREQGEGDGPPIAITASDNWHPGVVGLLASRLKDKFKRPAFAISFDKNGKGSGSGRSIEGIDLGKLVRNAVDQGLLVKGGGHAMAAGITVEREKLGAFRAMMEAETLAPVQEATAERALKVDAALSADGATLDLLDLIDKAGPYGSGHSQPIFAFGSHRLVDVRLVGQNHLKLRFASRLGGTLEAIAFRAKETPLGDFLENSRGKVIHVAGTVGRNFWQGRQTVQLRVIDAAADNS